MPIKPISATKRLAPRDNTRTAATPKTPMSQQGSIVPHSYQAQVRSQQYHKNTAGPRAEVRRNKNTDAMNPNPSQARARLQGRRFPGLAN